MISRLAGALTVWAQRWVPDAYVIAILLTAIVFAMAVGMGGATPLQVVDAWGAGFWELLKFAMQMCVIMLGGFVLSQTKPVSLLLDRLVAGATNPTRAVLTVGLFSMLSALLNWGLSLAASGVIARKVGKACHAADFRLLIAAAYMGMSTTWHAGFSASAPLLMATEAGARDAGVPIVPTTATIFSTFNLLLTGIVVVLMALLLPRLHPKPEDTKRFNAELAEGGEEAASTAATGTAPEGTSKLVWSDWLDRSPLVTIAVAVLSVTFLARLFGSKPFGEALNLDTVNLLLLTLAIVLHWTPQSFLGACQKGGGFVWGIIIQFPFYAGIYGIIKNTDLQSKLADVFVLGASKDTFPVIVYWYSGVVNYFVPSGGSKWYIEAPYIMEATRALHVDPALTVMAYAWGDMMTDAIQPFWAIPLLGLAGLKFRDIMGFLTVVFLVYAALVSVAFLIAPRLY
jgi:short-chain fatty acids transporter